MDYQGSVSRRKFLRTAVAAGVAAGTEGLRPTHADAGATESTAVTAKSVELPAASAKEPITFPRRHTGPALARVSCPLGGIGTGGIGLGGRGNLQDWQIFNRSDLGNALEYSFPAMHVKVPGKESYSVVLERRLLPPYDLNQQGLGFANVPGLPRLEEAVFFGSFPTSRVEFQDAECPVTVALDAFSPFQPVDADASGLPGTVLTYEVHNPASVPAEVTIAWSLSNPITFETPVKGVDGRLTQVRTSGAMSGLYMTNSAIKSDDAMAGSFALVSLPGEGCKAEQLARWRGGSGWRVGPQHFWDTFTANGGLGTLVDPSAPIGSVSLRQTIAPGQTGKFRFLLTWHFPNRTPVRCGWVAPAGLNKHVIGNWYCTQFKDAWAVAEHLQEHLPVLEAQTRAFVSTLVASTLPAEVKDAASANLSTLVSNTSFRIADGSFHGFEGCGDKGGLGFGTCTHVWNYEVATQFLFPSLARSMRETSFGYATDADGHMSFRHMLPPSNEPWGPAAADGQMGQIVKLYFDWVHCGDDEWLRKQWPGAKRALAYAWRPGGWDERKFGVMDGVQHNTYDIELYGPNPMCSSWYLAALRAMSLMADAMDDKDLAAECRTMGERGSKWIDANLFNGEYYVQKVRGIPQDTIAVGLRLGGGAKDTMHPQFQIGDGCLVDQLVGQYMATVAGLGDLLDSAHIRKTLGSIYKYNYKRDLTHHSSVQRVYALNDEAALVICDFTVGTRPEVPLPYYAEIMTGFEYSAAMLMLANGMVDEGVECIGNIRRRYDGKKANPFDETEFGRHYARAMASWAAIPVLSGFQYDGRKKKITLAPKIAAASFQSIWSTPTGWGSFSITGQGLAISVVAGSLTLQTLTMGNAAKARAWTKTRLGNTTIATSAQAEGSGWSFNFEKPVVISSRESLRIG